MVDLDQIAELISETDFPRSAELRVISSASDERLIETTYRFSFDETGDYQWSTSTRPL
jgi:hypothetical protein